MLEIDAVLGAGGRRLGLDEPAEVRGHRYARHRRLGVGFVEVYPIGDFEAVAGRERVDDRGDGGQVERVAVLGGRPVEHFGPAVVSVVPAHHELDQGPKLAAQVRFGHPLGHLADFVEIRPLQEADQLGLGPVGAGRRPGSVLREANSHEAKPKHHTPNTGAFAPRWLRCPSKIEWRVWRRVAPVTGPAGRDGAMTRWPGRNPTTSNDKTR